MQVDLKYILRTGTAFSDADIFITGMGSTGKNPYIRKGYFT